MGSNKRQRMITESPSEPWKLEALRLYENGLSVAQIVLRIGHDNASVRRTLVRQLTKLPPDPPPWLPNALYLFALGTRPHEIARVCQQSTDAVVAMLEQCGVYDLRIQHSGPHCRTIPETQRRGAWHGPALQAFKEDGRSIDWISEHLSLDRGLVERFLATRGLREPTKLLRGPPRALLQRRKTKPKDNQEPEAKNAESDEPV